MACGTVEAEIVAIGSRGDGIAETAEGRYYVPFTVPGDRVRLTVRDGDVAEVERLADGSARRAPTCRHFGECGGCALQHLADDAYAAWKRDRVVEALARRGLAAEVAPAIRVPPGSRRRVRLGARSTVKGIVLGFKARRSHRLVDITECPVARTEIVVLLGPLRAALSDCLHGAGVAEISVTAADGGLDVAVEAAPPLDLSGRERLARFAEASDLARLSWDGEAVVQRRAPRAVFAGVAVGLPPGGFLQPTGQGEAALIDIVTEALSPATAVADLFAGCGAFTFPLAMAGKRVWAADSDGEQIAALKAAARGSGLDGRIDAEPRDLERRPWATAELSALDGLVLDPPRVGAAAQAREIAAAPIPVVAYASCNPGTFARDARLLVDGGYRLESVTPIDQFLFSAEVELIGVFRR